VPGATADRLAVISASASADDGNVPANTLDGSLLTRWSASGDGQWILFDLGSNRTIGSVKIAWYQGDARSSRFDIQTSDSGTNWSTVFTGQSSGASTSLEEYDLTDSSGQYLRVVGHGNSRDRWNSITEGGAKVSTSGCHFKAGCYTQSNTSHGDAPTAYGEVIIFGLSVTHQ
jgi:hypothetical protein